MKKTLLLLGALAILSTTAMGNDITPETNHKLIREHRDEMLGRFETSNDTADAAYEIAGSAQKRVNEVNDRSYKNEYDVAENKRNIEEHKNTINDLSEKVASIPSVGALQNTKNMAYENRDYIRNAADGMIESAEKLDMELTTTGVDNKFYYPDAGKVQAEIFDKTVDVVAKSRDDIANLENNSATKEEVKVLGAKVDTIDTKINGVSDSLTAKDKAVNARVDAVNTKFEEVSNNLVAKDKVINARIDGVSTDLTDHKTAVNSSIENIRTDLASKNEKIDAVAGAASKNREDIATNKGNIEKNKNTIASVGRVVSDTYRNHNDAASGMKESVEKHLGEFEHSVADNGTTNGAVAGKVQAEAFDVVAGAVGTNIKDIKENTAKVETNGVAIASNGDLIAKNTTDLASHKEESLARDKKIEVAISDLKDTDEKVNTAIGRLEDADKKFAETDGKLLATDEKLIQTDKDLQAADKKINENIGTLHKHDEAVYETVGVTRDGSGTEIKAVKADVNRAMILNLEENAVTKAEVKTVETDIATNTANIATNKAKTEENEGKISINSQQIDQALELADNNSEHIEKNSKRIDGLEKKVDGLESKMNKGLAMAAATSSIVYPHLGRGDVGIGAGMGGYGGSQAIAIGVAMQPTENVRINTNVSTSDTSDTMYGAGVGYKFNIFGS